MTDDELAFYDALGVNDSAVQVLGNDTLKKIALELTQMIRKSVTIDCTALSNTAGTSILHITSAPTNSSLRPVDRRFINRYRMVKFEPTGNETVTTTVY